MIKVSHEVPKCLLNLSRVFNDYDFCLPHLMDQDEEYRDFFLESKKLGRYIVMDNSLHELGKAYDFNRLQYWLKELKPNEFVVPDVWQDKTQTLVQAKYWKQFENLYEDTTFVAVVQGKSFPEARECYLLLKDLGYKKIAISYGADWYTNFGPYDPNYIDVGKMLGRIYTINRLFEEKIIKKTDKIHLLGCSLPQEFSFYEDCDFIESIDTSNPIMAALDNTKYQDRGLLLKPKSNINNNFNINKSEVDIELLNWNINKFREINKL